MASPNAARAQPPDLTRALAALESDYPITLLPVRIETRFATATGNAKQAQLWVRIYPDDCWVDTFEPTLSKDELGNAKLFWSAYWRAGGVEADERAAWRSLVAAHGSGRSNFILDHFVPLNPPPPVKAQPSDVILVIATAAAPAPADATALTTYWQAVWLADGDRTGTSAAKIALQAAVGDARADQLIADFMPVNLGETPAAPLTRADVTVTTAFVVFPADPPVQDASWSRAPRIGSFPDCFIVVAFNGGAPVLSAVGTQVTLPLYVGPDPGAAPADTIHVDPASGDLIVPANLQWMVDFPAAVAAGVGIEIDLTAEQARAGFDRLFVVGIQSGATAQDGQAALSELLGHHASSGSGLEILRQGTPTHNTTGAGSGYSRRDDPDESFTDRNKAPLFTVSADVMQMRDGQVLADALGIDSSYFFQVHGADGTDQIDARAMQTTLWPATLGYWMDKLMAPVFSDDAVESARWYFTNYVRGRGVVPAVRIGAQPYGILPTTAFSRIGWLAPPARDAGVSPAEHAGFLAQLYPLLRRFDAEWTRMSASVSYVGKAGDPHQILLDIVGLHPDSVEFHARYAETLAALWNLVNLTGRAPALWPSLNPLQNAGTQLLQSLGYTGSEQPELLRQFFVKTATLIGMLIDDRASSEATPVRAYTDDGRNYLRWLYDAAQASLDALQQEQGFSGNQTPQALLYLLLRHALMLGYYDASYRLYRSAGFLTTQQLAALKPEPAFVHVDAQTVPSESRFARLYTVEPRITSNANQLVSDYITANYPTLPEAADFASQLAAVGSLQDLPTAALERLLAEHVDTCSYRFDSWLLGLAALRLEAMRSQGRQQQRPGTYLGAYGWLEEVRPASAPLQPMDVLPEIVANFPGSTPLMQDPRNGGYIAAPSLAQAKTGAVLRSAYLANATSGNPQTLAVNLSSDRVRLALSLLEGIRAGQSLGALLGYRFERGLHDDHALAEVDKFIYPLRKAFPLVADGITATQTGPDVSIEALEARNVLDGRKLIAQIQSSGQTGYPFGWTATPLPAATTAEAVAINMEANRLLDAYDAVADLALAEGVHQAVQGNFDRLAGTLETYSTGHFPPDPEVIQTPSVGVSVTHRVAVHFLPAPASPPGATPRALMEPGLDEWLARVLPPLSSIKCTVSWSDPLTDTARTRVVSLSDLELRPIDVVALVRTDDRQAMTELDDRVSAFVLTTHAPRPDARLMISYLTAPANDLSVFAASALIRSLRSLVVRSRPLRATDVLLQAGVIGDPNATATIDRARLSTPLATYATLSADLAAFVTQLAPWVQDPVTNHATLLSQVDVLMTQATGLLERSARFNLPQSGWGFLIDWKQVAFTDLIAAVAAVVTRWDARLADYALKLQAYNALAVATPDADRFQALRVLEGIVSSSLVVPLPATPAAFLTTVQNKAQAFQDRRDLLDATTRSTTASFSALLASVQSCLPITAFDSQALTTTPFEDRVITLCSDLYRAMAGHGAAVASRLTSANAALQENDDSAAAAQKVAALQRAAKAILGDDFTLYPQFVPAASQASDWAGAYAASTAGTLLSYLTQTLQFDFPVEEWLAGVSRVRPALHVWEAVVNLASALQPIDLPLTPIQLPLEPGAPWVALQYPPDYTVSGDHLLYTAHYPPAGFDETQPQCGLLLDEWTEVIPSQQRTAGVAFNFDRPNSEPPQSILIVTPASPGETWQWEDLLGALNETLDLAKKRAVEPVHLDPSTVARFLPATVTATTTYAISISATLAASNGVFRQIQEPGR